MSAWATARRRVDPLHLRDARPRWFVSPPRTSSTARAPSYETTDLLVRTSGSGSTGTGRAWELPPGRRELNPRCGGGAAARGDNIIFLSVPPPDSAPWWCRHQDADISQVTRPMGWPQGAGQQVAFQGFQGQRGGQGIVQATR